MDLNAVEARLAGHTHCPTKIEHQLIDLRLLQLPVEGWRIQIESTRSAYRHAATGVAVGHVATMSQLNGCLGTMGMDGIGETLQVRDDLLTHPKLAVERQA